MAGKPLVFLLHGMGEQSSGWSQSFVDALDEAIDAHGYEALQKKRDKKTSIAGAMQLVPINYGKYFTDLTESWQDKSVEVISLASPEMRPKVERAVGWLSESEMSKNEFAWTHLLDVFFWLTSSNLRNVVKNFVADSIASKILARRKQDKFDRFKTSIVSYSLGTAVAHHTLQDMASGAWSGATGFAPNWFRFDTIHTIANISKLLDFDANYPVYDGFVRPGPYGDPGSYAFYFCDYRHPYDPFALPAPFEPPAWPANLFDAQKPSHVHQLNVHALEHYVANPVVHIRLLRGWFGYNCISAKEELDALNDFPLFELPDDADDGGTIEHIEALAASISQTVGSSPYLIDILKGIALIALAYEQI